MTNEAFRGLRIVERKGTSNEAQVSHKKTSSLIDVADSPHVKEQNGIVYEQFQGRNIRENLFGVGVVSRSPKQARRDTKNELVVRLLREGYSPLRVVAEVGISARTVYRIRKLNNIKPTPQHEDRTDLVNNNGIEVKRIPLKEGREMVYSKESILTIKEIGVFKDSMAPALILGETGTGKDLAAEALHALSQRKHEPYIPVNCAAIPREVFESEVFGHSKGAFTGAVRSHSGYLEQVGNGTLFLDEITEVPIDSQAKLLRVVEDGVIQVVGGENLKDQPHFTGRLIFASNQDLGKAVREGMLREDLFYRIIKGGIIETIPLNARPKEILPLTMHFLDKFRRNNHNFILTDSAKQILLGHKYHGNVRELETLIEHACLRAEFDYGKVDGGSMIIYSSHIEESLVKIKRILGLSEALQN